MSNELTIIQRLRAVLSEMPPVQFTLGKVGYFPATEQRNSDVVYVEVICPHLHAMRAKIAEAVEHTDTHPGYHPHATIAYVRAGKGKKYLNLNKLEGMAGEATVVEFSGKDGQKTEIPLRDMSSRGSGRPLARPSRALLNLASDAAGIPITSHAMALLLCGDEPCKACEEADDGAYEPDTSMLPVEFQPEHPAVQSHAMAILLAGDCGTGAGGFKPGNTCARGGRYGSESGVHTSKVTLGNIKGAGAKHTRSYVDAKGRHIDEHRTDDGRLFHVVHDGKGGRKKHYQVHGPSKAKKTAKPKEPTGAMPPHVEPETPMVPQAQPDKVREHSARDHERRVMGEPKPEPKPAVQPQPATAAKASPAPDLSDYAKHAPLPQWAAREISDRAYSNQQKEGFKSSLISDSGKLSHEAVLNGYAALSAKPNKTAAESMWLSVLGTEKDYRKLPRHERATVPGMPGVTMSRWSGNGVERVYLDGVAGSGGKVWLESPSIGFEGDYHNRPEIHTSGLSPMDAANVIAKAQSVINQLGANWTDIQTATRQPATGASARRGGGRDFGTLLAEGKAPAKPARPALDVATAAAYAQSRRNLEAMYLSAEPKSHVMALLLAGDDGYWRTIDSHKVHFKGSPGHGTPDKGNPHVIAAMKGGKGESDGGERRYVVKRHSTGVHGVFDTHKPKSGPIESYTTEEVAKERAEKKEERHKAASAKKAAESKPSEKPEPKSAPEPKKADEAKPVVEQKPDAPKGRPSPEALKKSVADAVERMTETESAGMVPIHKIRDAIAKEHGEEAATPEALNKHILDLHQSGKAQLVSISDMRQATQEQLDKSIKTGYETFFYVELTDKPKTAGSKAATAPAAPANDAAAKSKAGIEKSKAMLADIREKLKTATGREKDKLENIASGLEKDIKRKSASLNLSAEPQSHILKSLLARAG